MPIHSPRLFPARWLSVLTVLLSLVALLLPLHAHAWGNPNTAHSPGWCTTGGMYGNPEVVFTNRPIDIQSVLETACEVFVKEHATPSTTYFWEQCTPIVSPPEGYVGAHQTTFEVTGVLKGMRNSDGLTWTVGTGNWGLAQCSCRGGRYDIDGFGEDGLCYCPKDHLWIESLEKCVPYVDILSPPLSRRRPVKAAAPTPPSATRSSH